MLTIKLAFRNLFRNTRRTVLTVMLISLSLTALIAVDGVMRGMLTLLVDNVTGTIGGDAQIHRVGYRENLDVDLFMEKDRKSTRLNSSHVVISYAVFCLKKKNI